MLTAFFDKKFAKWLQIWHEIPLSCKLHSTVHFQQRHVDLLSSSKWFWLYQMLHLHHLLLLPWKSQVVHK